VDIINNSRTTDNGDNVLKKILIHTQEFVIFGDFIKNYKSARVGLGIIVIAIFRGVFIHFFTICNKISIRQVLKTFFEKCWSCGINVLCKNASKI
jgi:hypothetical protein